MLILPAIDVRGGQCVRLQQGDYAQETVFGSDPVAMAQYLGAGDAFEKSMTDFSSRYADQNDDDFHAFVQAIRTGRLAAIEGV